MLDEAVGYMAQDSLAAAQRLLIDALEAAASLTTLSDRGAKGARTWSIQTPSVPTSMRHFPRP